MRAPWHRRACPRRRERVVNAKRWMGAPAVYRGPRAPILNPLPGKGALLKRDRSIRPIGDIVLGRWRVSVRIELQPLGGFAWGFCRRVPLPRRRRRWARKRFARVEAWRRCPTAVAAHRENSRRGHLPAVLVIRIEPKRSAREPSVDVAANRCVRLAQELREQIPSH